MGAFQRRVVDRKGKAEGSRDNAGDVKWGLESIAPSRKPRSQLFAVMREGIADLREQLANKGAVSVDDRIENWIQAVDEAMQEPFIEDAEGVEAARPDGKLSEEKLSLKKSDEAVVQVAKTCDNVVLPML